MEGSSSMEVVGATSPGATAATGATASAAASASAMNENLMVKDHPNASSVKEEAAPTVQNENKACDTPMCAFCNEGEDSDDADEDPVIDTKQTLANKNIFAHELCLDWTGDIWQDEQYAWCNVGRALSRSRKLKCAQCGEHGASLGCRRPACTKSWHVPCAFELRDHQKLAVDEEEHMVACPGCAKTLEREAEERLRLEREKGTACPPPAKRPKPTDGGGSTAAEERRRAEKAEAEVAKLRRELDAVRARSKPHIESKIQARKERDEALRQLEASKHADSARESEAVAAAAAEARVARGELEASTRRVAGLEAHLRAIRGEASAMDAMSLEEVEQLAQLGAAAQVALLARCDELRRSEERERSERTTCAVCLIEPRAVAYGPCGHVACCQACAPKIDACPLCKRGVAQRLPVFLP